MTKSKVQTRKVTKVWLGVFVLWGVFLVGLPNALIGTPGVIQAVRLNSLLQSRQKLLTATEEEVARLEQEGNRLEKNKLAQEREIRRVLGYAGSDEIIFDFTSTQQAAALQR